MCWCGKMSKELSINLENAIKHALKALDHLNNVGYIVLTVIEDNADIKKELENLESSLKKTLENLNEIAEAYKV